jgi:hypothetical protein
VSYPPESAAVNFEEILIERSMGLARSTRALVFESLMQRRTDHEAIDTTAISKTQALIRETDKLIEKYRLHTSIKH